MKTQWYVVTGRIEGWDEDTIRILRAADTQDAMRNFRDIILTEKSGGEDYDADSAPTVYVNQVVSCGTTRPVHEYAT